MDLIHEIELDAREVLLVAGPHRTFSHGPSADWSLELVPSPGALP